MPEISNHNARVQTRTTFAQRCLPGGDGSSTRFDGHIFDLEDSSVFHEPTAPNREVNPDLSAQFGDRQVGGPGHITTVNDLQGNRGNAPSPHMIVEKAFYTEIQPNYYIPDPTGTIDDPFGSAGDYVGQQITALRVDLTQGSTAFRANCVIVKGTMSVVNQPLAGLSGQFNVAQGGSLVNAPGQLKSMIPTIDFEHIFICQPLASKTTDENNPFPIPYGPDYIPWGGIEGNPNPLGPGDASGYFSDVEFPFSSDSVALGRVSTKCSNYFRIRNKGFDPNFLTSAPQDFDWYQDLPLATPLNTPQTNFALFSRGNEQPNSNGQPWNLGNSAANDISVTDTQVVTDGTIISAGGPFNLNWVDFKYNFHNYFKHDFLHTYADSYTSNGLIGYAPRVVVKGTYLLI